ncbi:STAS domain-containing protein [Micromonospora soli]|uniref:STAS domain-containing protein n=1 Tax=Micromonospora sp. NBRC 110009 TaxID=3061627 RepID=UPI002670D254|nr:STAS domain-containing protein [Micromonospora sp. NBRC 110009]WKT98337.1 STAS domain-containing protein [Micromonospora sp. NBRC 110009]
MAFAVTYAQRDEGDACLQLAGELDLSTAPQLNDAIDRLIAEGRRQLLLDLSQLTFCDSTGIAAFVRGDNLLAADDGWLRVTGATGRVARVLQITGLADLLRYEADAPDPASSAGL